MSKKENKKKKEKVTYYDDNSTLVDMSNVTRTGKKKEPRPSKPPSSFSDKWNTYWSAVNMMMKPMFLVLGAIAFLYFLLFLISNLG